VWRDVPDGFECKLSSVVHHEQRAASAHWLMETTRILAENRDK
jgi:hypothetical protein